MKKSFLRLGFTFSIFMVVSQILCPESFSQQRPDTAFSFVGQTPAYTPGKGPLIAIDAGHHNFHTLEGGFSPLGKLLRSDGYRVQSVTLPLFTLKYGTGPRILIIANALHASDTSDWIAPNPSAFTPEEVSNIRQWVLDGGRLLLIADHMPFAGAANELASAFGVQFLNGFAFTGERTWPPSRFTRAQGSLLPSPVTDSGAAQYAISEVATFTGSAFTIPGQAIPVLKFKAEHWSLQPDTAWAFHPSTQKVMLENHCQGALMKFGKGKIAVFGEAAMFTAQIVNDNFKVGINSPDAPENARFVMNVVHWLDRDYNYIPPFSGLSAVKSPQRNEEKPERLKKSLQLILDSLTREKVIPGITFAVRFKDGRMLSLASGYADQEQETKMLPDAVMFSGSVGKTYVAALILKLQEQGLLKISDKAGKYLAGEDWFANVPNAAEITLEMLLNHTAGVPEYVYDRAIWEALRKNPDKTWSVSERLSFVSGLTPSNPAGKGWAYADSHYILLGLVIEKITGKDYYEVLNEMILRPFGLKDTKPALSRSIPGLVPGYTALTDEMMLPEKVGSKGLYAFNPQLEWTGGGLVTTVSNLCLWASALYGGKVIGPESLTLMETPTPFKTTLAEGAGYGMGCFVGEKNGVRYYGHTGFVPGYISVLHYLPDNGISMAMQFNSDQLHGKAANEVFNALKKTILDPIGN